MNVETSILPDADTLIDLAQNDTEFMMSARFWTGGLRITVGNEIVELGIREGKPCRQIADPDRMIELNCSTEIWQAMIKKNPPRLLNDIIPAFLQGLSIGGHELTVTQYYAAVQRLVELLRPKNDEQRMPMVEARTPGTHDAPVGRYVHVTLKEQDYRIYYEEAGQGIPIVLHHTAGAHGTQWRHLFEMPEITEHFRLIAYDLPFHGKSIPPVGYDWWKEEYKLTGEFVRALPVALVEALNLKNPIFMGCSVGGVLALDLAFHYPDVFDHVISVEGALKVMTDADDFFHQSFWHPQVSNEYKGRMMHSLTGPRTPEAYRRETIQTYMAGWPPAFLGDLHYYYREFDLSLDAMDIETSKTGVHILNGEYDFSGSIEGGEVAHSMIEGSTHTVMDDLGHFPMCEDPMKFKEYLLPILNKIRGVQ